MTIAAMAPSHEPLRRQSLGAESAEEDHIRVICRLRPPNARETQFSNLGVRSCVSVDGDKKTVSLKAASGPKHFTFDHAVGPEGDQDVLFQIAGKQATRACLEGYNGTIFCYGQTGSGKTYTMFGAKPDSCDSADDRRGLVPRVLEYLFASIDREEHRNGGAVKHLCRCSFYEIFSERVFDLLDAGCSMGGLQVREDMKKGVYVEGLTEEAVDSPHQAYQVLTRGYRNRHVGETAMNRESSRSHAVFSVVVESRELDALDGVTRSRHASFNLVDLAGSERQSASGATGERLKEAGSINKSLSALGNVINALVEVSAGKTRYIPYRDSRLTFLLRDSLGGNAKTFLVAALSPADDCFAETLSTLKFAQRAKMIKNKAVVNEDTSGTVEALQKQLRHLKQELLAARAVITTSSVPRLAAADGALTNTFPAEEAAAAHDAPAGEGQKIEMLLRDALERSIRMEKARELAEQRARHMQQTVERLEQALLSEKMVRKFKESTIQRLSQRARGDVASASAAVDDPATIQAAALKQEVDALRKELEQPPVDAVKWRVTAEEAKTQLSALADEKGLGMWVAGREEGYQSKIQEQLKDALDAKAELAETVANLQEELKARPPPRSRLSDGGLQRLRQAEQQSADLELQLAAAVRQAQESQSQLSEARAQAAQAKGVQTQQHAQLTLLARDVDRLAAENQALKNSKDAELSAMQERLVALQVQQEEQKSRQDVEERLSAACKDNYILLSRLRETHEEASSTAKKLEKSQAEVHALEQQTTAMSATAEDLQQQIQHEQDARRQAVEALERQLEEMTQKLRAASEDMDKQTVVHHDKVSQLTTELDEAASRHRAVRAEKEEIVFQLANLQEDHDTLTELLEFTTGKSKELEEALAEARSQVHALGADVAQKEATLQHTRSQVSSLEDQLDRVGGDAAEERKQLRQAREANDKLTGERSQLLAALEEARGAVEAAEEKRCTEAREVAEERKIQAQVVEDLTGQVSKLREELSDVAAGAEEARAEATGLVQERNDLLRRVAEAEDVNASLSEETKAYLAEISDLKAAMADERKNHAEIVGELTLEVSKLGAELSNMQAAAEKARQEVTELLQEKEELRRRCVSIWDARFLLGDDGRRVSETEDACVRLSEQIDAYCADISGLKATVAEERQIHAQVAEDLQAQVSKLQEQLSDVEAAAEDARVDAAGLAEEKQMLLHRMSEAEDSNAELSHQITARMEEISCLTATMSLEHEAHTQVVEDLTEQVLRLQNELLELNVAAEDARVDAAGLAQEKQELLCRLSEGEHANAGLMQEVHRHLAEISGLEDSMAQCEEAHASAVAVLTAEYSNSMAQAQAAKEALQLNVAQLQSEAEALKAAVAHRDARMSELMAELDQAREAHASAVAALTEEHSNSMAQAHAAKEALQLNVAQLQSEAEALNAAVAQRDARVSELMAELDKAREAQQQAEHVVEELTEKHARAETGLQEAQEQVADTTVRLMEHEKSIEKMRRLHDEQLAASNTALKDAEARVASMETVRSALSDKEAALEALTAEVELLQEKLEEAVGKRSVAEERCNDLAEQVAELSSVQADVDRWLHDKPRLETEVKKAAKVVKDAQDRCETVEKQLDKAMKELEQRDKEVGELRTANVRLIGHANTRQKIQMHNRLKEELQERTNRCKQLEAENYELRLATHAKAGGGRGRDARSETHDGVLANVTNVVGARSGGGGGGGKKAEDDGAAGDAGLEKPQPRKIITRSQVTG